MPAHGADRHGAQQALFPARVACNPTAMTDIRPITPDSLAAAGKALREGRLVAFPTETVYGLGGNRSEEHTSELQSLMRISYAVFCLKKKIATSSMTILEIPTNTKITRYNQKYTKKRDN